MQPYIEESDMQNWGFEPLGLSKPGKTCMLKGTAPCLVRQEAAGRPFWRIWKQNEPFLLSEPGYLAGYPDHMLTHSVHNDKMTNYIPHDMGEPEVCCVWSVSLDVWYYRITKGQRNNTSGEEFLHIETSITREAELPSGVKFPQHIKLWIEGESRLTSLGKYDIKISYEFG